MSFSSSGEIIPETPPETKPKGRKNPPVTNDSFEVEEEEDDCSEDEETQDSVCSNMSTSTPLLSRKQNKPNLDISAVVPMPRNNVLNETVAPSDPRPAFNRIQEDKKKSRRRIIEIDSSSSSEDEATVKIVEASESDSSYFSNGEAKGHINGKASEARPSRHEPQRSSGSGGTSSSGASVDHSESADEVLDAVEKMGAVRISSKAKKSAPVVDLDDLDLFNLSNIVISKSKAPSASGFHKQQSTHRAEDPHPSSHWNKKPVETATIETDSDDDIQVLEDFHEPEVEGKLVKPKVPGQKKTIFLPELPTPTVDLEGRRDAPIFLVVDKFIAEIARTMETAPKEGEPDPLGKPKYLIPDLYEHQKYGLQWLWWRERVSPFGGVLADEMGLGKTVMLLALICRSKERSSDHNESTKWKCPDERRLVPSDATLVVCPASVMGQWENEVKTKAPRLKVGLYHGPNRSKSSSVLSRHDVIITTFQTLASEIPKLSEQTAEACTSPLIRIKWQRVVLDEGHVIRNHQTGMSQAACRLNAEHRWIVTGTPIHNRAGDFYSIVKFLHMAPFDDPKVWAEWIGMKMPTSKQSSRLCTIAKALLLRRTKTEVAMSKGENERGIPPKEVLDIIVELKEDEREVYDHVYEFLSDQFKALIKDHDIRQRELQSAANNFIAGKKPHSGKGNAPSMAVMFTILLRCRQAAVLPRLIQTMLDDVSDNDDDEYDPTEQFATMKNPVFDAQYKSAKLERMYEDLDELKRECKARGERMEKVVIVSQWTTLLSIVDTHLTQKGYTTVTISGAVKIGDRTDIMCKFNADPKRPQIMLLSLQAGGVGLNLVGANHLFFLDIHWNPQLELQAQDRVHRFGQTKPVTIRRYISANTIESRVMALQASKLDLANGLLAEGSRRRGAGLSIADMRKLFDV